MTAPEIKICGIAREEDAVAALAAGADYLGFVLHPASPRFVTPAALERLRGRLPDSARCIGVFVDRTPEEVERICRDCGLFAAQLAGVEPAEAFAGFGFPVWRVVREAGIGWIPDPAAWPAARHVVDAPGPLPGGSGRRASWPLAARLAETRPIVLAGGLTPENVAEAVRRVRPSVVDVSSGVEATPGRKDADKIVRFITEARTGAAR